MQTRFLVVEVCFSGSTVCTNFVCIGIQVFLRSTTCSTILWLWWTTEELCGHRVQLWEVVNLPETEICCSCNILFSSSNQPDILSEPPCWQCGSGQCCPGCVSELVLLRKVTLTQLKEHFKGNINIAACIVAWDRRINHWQMLLVKETFKDQIVLKAEHTFTVRPGKWIPTWKPIHFTGLKSIGSHAWKRCYQRHLLEQTNTMSFPCFPTLQANYTWVMLGSTPSPTPLHITTECKAIV